MSEMSRERAIKLAKKLKALADRGIDGEKNNARERLNSLLKEHGLEEYQIADGLRTFERTTLNEGSVFLTHIIKSVNPDARINVKQRKTQLIMEVVLSDIEYKEVRQKYKFFWRGYNRARKLLLASYINKHWDYLKSACNKNNNFSIGLSLEGNQQEAQERQHQSQSKSPPADANNLGGRPFTDDETRKVRAMMVALDNLDYRKIIEMQETDNASDNEYKESPNQ